MHPRLVRLTASSLLSPCVSSTRFDRNRPSYISQYRFPSKSPPFLYLSVDYSSARCILAPCSLVSPFCVRTVVSFHGLDPRVVSLRTSPFSLVASLCRTLLPLLGIHCTHDHDACSYYICIRRVLDGDRLQTSPSTSLLHMCDSNRRRIDISYLGHLTDPRQCCIGMG